MQGPQVEPLGGLIRIVDPHGHVYQQQIAQLALVDPAASTRCRRHKTMIQVYSKTDSPLARLAHHLARLHDVVGYWFFAQLVFSGVECGHGRHVVSAAVFNASGSYTDRIQILLLEHFVESVISSGCIALGGLIGAFAHQIADCHQLGLGTFVVNFGMVITYSAQTNYSYFHHDFLIF